MAGYVTSTDRSREKGIQILGSHSPFIQSRDPAHEMVHLISYLNIGLHTSLNLAYKSLPETLRGLFHGESIPVPPLVRLTFKHTTFKP